MNKKFIYTIYIILLSFISSNAESKLSQSELLKISGGSVTVALVGLLAENSIDESRKSLIHGPILFDSYFREHIGGDLTINSRKTNFLDNKTGAVITPVIGFSILLWVDYAYYNKKRNKMLFDDAFLFTTGLMFTSGVTGIFKGLVARERPFYFEDLNRTEQFENDNKLSFFSGHSSLAFYSMHYLNKRLSTIMKEKNISQKWRVMKSASLYGWASYVAYSRMQASKHYATDVIVSAGVGIFIAELFYKFSKTKMPNLSLRSSNSKLIVSYNF